MSVKARYQRFWLDFAVPRAKLAWLRAGFFGLVGLDAFLQIEHAPRYGAGDFNVPHLAILDSIVPPSRGLMLGVFLVQAYLAFRIACGAATRASLAVLATLYGYAYFVSQLDSYQHHYLVFLLLVIACFVPWGASDAAASEASQKTKPRGKNSPARPRAGIPVTSWALRLLCAQIAILYVFAALAKLDAAWLDGTTLATQLRPSFARDVADALGTGAAAKLILLTELFLAVAWLWPALWLPGLAAGIGLHAGIELLSGGSFDIGIFSYFMLALYVVFIPDRVIVRAHARIERVAAWLGERIRLLAATGARAHIAASLVVIAGLALVWPLPFAETTAVLLVIAALAAAELVPWPARSADPAVRRHGLVRAALVHLVACAAILALHLATDQAHEHYKFWGGASRRLERWQDAKQAYAMLARISPDYGPAHYHLASIARRDGRLDDALAGYRRAQTLAPGDYRAFLDEAEIHHAAGRGPEALAAAERALALSPRDQRDLGRARAIRDAWARTAPQP